jgi:hypothetical protein
MGAAMMLQAMSLDLPAAIAKQSIPDRPHAGFAFHENCGARRCLAFQLAKRAAGWDSVRIGARHKNLLVRCGAAGLASVRLFSATLVLIHK